MNVFHLLFVIATGFLLLACYEIYKRFGSRNVKTEASNRGRLTVIVSSLSIGIFLMFSSVPGAFLNQPHWLTEKLYRVVEKVIDVFT